MSVWRETTLGEVILLQRGFDLTEKESPPGDYPVISSGGVGYTTAIPRVEGPGVVTGRKGVLGKVHFSPGPYWPHDTTLWVKDFKGSDPRYAYYLLQTLDLASLDAGSSNPTLNRNHAHLLRVRVPDLGTQHQISTILGAMDDLIENNRRRIELLEQMAQAIYREWFVHFRYPGHEEATIVDSPLGPIPEGWEVTTVAGCAKAPTRGISPKYADDGAWTVLNQKCIRNQRVSLERARRQERAVPPAKQVQFGDVLINSTGVGTLGRIAIFLGDHSALTVDSHVTLVRPSDPLANPWFGMNLLSLQAHFEALGTGSTGQTELSRKDIGATALVRPPLDLRRCFAESAWPMLTGTTQLLEQNRRLAGIRNLLLPKLVTGQIDVSNLDLDALTESVA